jgi:uncharacterized cupredoxin-like copper-binding protein
MLRTVLVVAAVLALAGCGGNYSASSGSPGSTTNGTAGASQTVSISEAEFKLSPSSLSVDKAGKVTLQVKNTGSITHALEIEGNGVEEKTGSIDPGQSKTITVDLSKGSYEIYCPIDGHRAKGMEGTLQVGASAGGMTTQQTTTDDKGGGYYGG